MPDRDQSIEQLLRRMMADDVSPVEACPDGETFAAWSEGALRGGEAAAVERHVADCDRCRALMAAFVRTTPAQPVTESLWRRWHLGWMVPLATAATAAAIWVALPSTGAPPSSSQESNTVAHDRVTNAPSVARSQEAGGADGASTTASEGRPQQEKAKMAESVSNELRQRADAAAGTASAAAPPATPPAALAERAEADTKKEAAADSAFAPLAAQRRAFAPEQIVSQDGSARWRIVNGRQVERSTDAGTQWTSLAINAPDRLTAAAAPSATVCWIVGARGAVYLTTDGTRFDRLPFTEMVDLTSVFASDALTATVSSSDGRSWRTTDQGRTWSTTR